MTDQTLDHLGQMVARCPAVTFAPVGLFVAHCGVLTVVLDGFDSCVLALKDEIERAVPDLEEEQEGSMWPKVSLAVLKGRERLSEEDLRRLLRIADQWEAGIRSSEHSIHVDRLKAVEYACRSLERRVREVVLPLGAPSPSGPTPPPHHARFVRSVVAQFTSDRIGEYLPAVNRPGHRESHYREYSSGWSLVADVEMDSGPFVGMLRNAVEEAVPGKYTWFDPRSWHVTIRSLNPAR